MDITCNQDCFNCKFDDCILTDEEIEVAVMNEKEYKTPEQLRQQAIKYYWEHREVRKEYKKKHYAEHREELKKYAREYKKKYYKQHHDEINEVARKRKELKKKGLI